MRARNKERHPREQPGSRAMNVPMPSPKAFAREVDLAGAATEWLKARYPGVLIAEEVDFRWGAPDLIAARPERLRQRLASGLAPVFDPHQAAVLREAAGGPLARARLEEMTSLRWGDYRQRVLCPLQATGLLARDESDTYHRTEVELIDPFGSLIAVELKLRDWRKALAQGSRYRAFADEAWVAMPSARIGGELLACASRLSLGVVGLAPDGWTEHLAAVRAPACDPSVRQLASERIFGCYVGMVPTRAAGSPRGRLSAAQPEGIVSGVS
jgi:hypothetical protein